MLRCSTILDALNEGTSIRWVPEAEHKKRNSLLGVRVLWMGDRRMQGEAARELFGVLDKLRTDGDVVFAEQPDGSCNVVLTADNPPT